MRLGRPGLAGRGADTHGRLDRRRRVNGEARLRKVIPGGSDDLIAALAAKPAGEVDLIVAALRQARRDALQHEAERKRQRKKDGRKYNHWDESDLTGRNL